MGEVTASSFEKWTLMLTWPLAGQLRLDPISPDAVDANSSESAPAAITTSENNHQERLANPLVASTSSYALGASGQQRKLALQSQLLF